MFLVDIDILWLDIDILRPDIDILWLDIDILISSLKILFSISEYFGDKLGQFYPPFEGIKEFSTARGAEISSSVLGQTRVFLRRFPLSMCLFFNGWQ